MIRVIAMGGSVAVAAMLAAWAGPTVGQDIIVNAGTPRMLAGLWTFHADAATRDAVPGVVGPRGRGPQDWSLCIRDGDTPAILEQLIGARAVFDDGMLCSPMGLTITRNRVNGSRRCPLPPIETRNAGYIVGVVAETRLRARIGESNLSADYQEQIGLPGADVPKTRWRVSARRIDTCEGPAVRQVAASAPAPAPTPVQTGPAAQLVRSDAAQPEDEADPLPGAADHPAEADGGTAAPPPHRSAPDATPAQAEDIVVVARKLRRVRLHYASSGRALRWCHADISSGDARLDRIGCAMVRACVRGGSDTTPEVLGCVNRRIDTLDPVTGPLPKPVARGTR
jgi:hypothetical protein